MNKEKFLQWLRASTIRAVKTFAQSLTSTIGVEVVAIGAINWPMALGIAATAMVLSYLTSIAGLPEVE